jgi:hypothetical protein
MSKPETTETITVYKQLIGKTFDKVFTEKDEYGDAFELKFQNNEKTRKFYHQEDCCESVYIHDIIGDLSDLEGTPILIAEEFTSEALEDYAATANTESYTWTFYKFATIKGHVTVRWLGQSNGYYSEGVSFV